MAEKISRRANARLMDSFPFGILFGLITAAFVTLLGAYLQLDPGVILFRASISGVVVGVVVSVGTSFVRIVGSESNRRVGRTKR